MKKYTNVLSKIAGAPRYSFRSKVTGEKIIEIKMGVRYMDTVSSKKERLTILMGNILDNNSFSIFLKRSSITPSIVVNCIKNDRKRHFFYGIFVLSTLA